MRSRVLNDQVEHRKTQHGLVEIFICVMEILMMVSIACEHSPEGGWWETQEALPLPIPVWLRSLGFSLSWPVAHKRACLRATMSAAGRNVHTISLAKLFVFLVVVVLFFNALILLPYFKWNKWLISVFLCDCKVCTGSILTTVAAETLFKYFVTSLVEDKPVYILTSTRNRWEGLLCLSKLRSQMSTNKAY